MRYFVSDLSHRKNLFIGDYDSYTIIKHGISSEYLFHLSKLGLLLFDHLLLPAAFFWQSENMAHLFLRLQQPIECGIILPIIRDSRSTIDIYDYFSHRMDESVKLGNIEVFKQPELASEIASNQNRKQVRLLESTKNYAHLDTGSIRQIYVNNWIKDLENIHDIGSLRQLVYQSRISSNETQQVLSVLREVTTHPQFSRASGIESIQKIIPRGRCRELLIDRASWLYLKSNADAYKSNIFYSKSSTNGLIFEDNLFLLADTLSVFGLTNSVISSLTIDQILQIRSSHEYLHFIEKYRSLVQTVYTRQENVLAIIQKKLEHHMMREEFFAKVLGSIKAVRAISSSLFLALVANYFSASTIDTSVLIGAGSFSALSSILMRLDCVNKIMDSKDFSDFKKYILSQKYEENILKKAGVVK